MPLHVITNSDTGGNSGVTPELDRLIDADREATERIGRLEAELEMVKTRRRTIRAAIASHQASLFTDDTRIFS